MAAIRREAFVAALIRAGFITREQVARCNKIVITADADDRSGLVDVQVFYRGDATLAAELERMEVDGG